MRLFYLFTLSLTTFILQADDLNDYTPIESPYILEGDRRLEEADKKWENFQEEIKWFLEYTKPPTTDLGNIESETDVKREWVQQYDEFSKNISDLQDEFLKFRTKVVNCILTNAGGNSSHQFLSYSSSLLEVTHWYVNYMEKTLFPHDWKPPYEKYIKEKTNSTNSN